MAYCHVILIFAYTLFLKIIQKWFNIFLPIWSLYLLVDILILIVCVSILFVVSLVGLTQIKLTLLMIEDAGTSIMMLHWLQEILINDYYCYYYYFFVCLFLPAFMMKQMYIIACRPDNIILSTIADYATCREKWGCVCCRSSWLLSYTSKQSWK